MSKFLSVRELALSLGCHPVTLYRLVEQGQIPFVKVGGRIRFETEAIAEWIEQKSFNPISAANPYPQVELSLANYDRLFLKGGVKLSREGKTWRYPFGSVFSRANKSGEKFYLYYRINGKRVRECVRHAVSRADAVRALSLKVADAFRSEYGIKQRSKKSVTIQGLKDEFMRTVQDKKSPKTIVSYENSWKHVKHFFDETPLADITAKDIEDYMMKRRDEGALPPTVNIEYFFLSAMFRKAVRWQYMESNPATGVERFREQNARERILSDAEIKRLLDAADASLLPILITLLGTGLRKMECLNLLWPDIDFRDGFIHVTMSKAGKGREVPMSALVWQTLKDLEDRKDPGSEIVFLSRRGKGRTDIKHQFKAACKKAGVKGCRIHDLRHTAASRMIANGTDLVTAARILGHATITMTAKYVHPTSAAMKAAVEKLAGFIQLKEASFVPALSPRPKERFVN
jgi:integrase/recombinase XerD